MSSPETTVLPLSLNERTQWLVRAIKIVEGMASEGIIIDGYEDPQEMMVELCDRLGLDDSDDPWVEVAEAAAR